MRGQSGHSARNYGSDWSASPVFYAETHADEKKQGRRRSRPDGYCSPPGGGTIAIAQNQ